MDLCSIIHHQNVSNQVIEYVSQYSVTQCLAKLSYLETDLLTGLLLHLFTQPFLNYSCRAHKTNNVNRLIWNHSVSVLTSHPGYNYMFKPGLNTTPLNNSELRVSGEAAGGSAAGLWYLSFMTLVLASRTGSLVWWPIRETVGVLARARGPVWRDEGDIQGCDLFSWTGVNQWAWTSRASWRAKIRLGSTSRKSCSQSQEDAMLVEAT